EAGERDETNQRRKQRQEKVIGDLGRPPEQVIRKQTRRKSSQHKLGCHLATLLPVAEGRLSRKRKVAIVSAVLLITVVVVLAIAAVAVAPLSEDAARERLVAALADRFDAHVELRELHLRTVPSLRAEGRGL